MVRALQLAALFLAVAILNLAARADDPPRPDAPPPNAGETATHEGIVVSAAANELVMKDDSGAQHSHQLGTDVRITVAGQPGKVDDLKPGMRVRVTTPKDDNKQALAIEVMGDPGEKPIGKKPIGKKPIDEKPR